MMMYFSPLLTIPNEKLYIAGESFAGQHIPYIANEIIKHNKEHGNVLHVLSFD